MAGYGYYKGGSSPAAAAAQDKINQQGGAMGGNLAGQGTTGQGFDESSGYATLAGRRENLGIAPKPAQNSSKGGSQQPSQPSGSKGGSQQPSQPKLGGGAATASFSSAGPAQQAGYQAAAGATAGMDTYRGGGQQAALNQAQAGPAQYDSMREYQDQAYNTAMSRLQPTIDADRRRFEQQLVNKGIDPNSEAGRNAFDAMSRQHNDMQNSAMFQAMQFGQNAQQQAFNQSAFNAGQGNQMNQFNAGLGQANDQFGASLGLQQGQLQQQNNQFNAGQFNNQSLQNAMMANNMAQFNAGQSNQMGMFNAGQQNNMNQFGRQLGFNYAQLGEQGRQFDQNLQRGYTNDLMGAMQAYYGMGAGQFGANQQSDLNQYNARQGVLGSVPGYNPAMIDVNGAANAATNSQQAAFNAGMAPWNLAGQVGGAALGAAMSDARLKEDVELLGVDERGIEWYSWTWNKEAEKLGLVGPSMGVIAQKVPEEYVIKDDPSGYLKVDYGKLMLAEVA